MNNNGDKTKSWFQLLGSRVSGWVADVAGHPFAQIGFLIICVSWFLVGWNVNLLTAALSILAITLTQMVLSRQNEREIDDRRRDVAMHAKLDELIAVTKPAKNAFVGIEEKEEEEIVQLKQEVKEAIDESPVARDPKARKAAERAVEAAAEELKREVKKKPASRPGSKRSPQRKRAAAK